MTDECPICLHTMDERTRYSLECKHVFDAVCLRKYIMVSPQPKCPICRKYITIRHIQENLRKCLYEASLADITECVTNFIHANFTEPNWKITPLHYAAGRGDLSVVQYIIRMGGDVNASASMGHTPLYVAAMNGHKSIVEYLLNHGANPLISRKGISPAMIARQQRHYQVAEYISQFEYNYY